MFCSRYAFPRRRYARSNTAPTFESSMAREHAEIFSAVVWAFLHAIQTGCCAGASSATVDTVSPHTSAIDNASIIYVEDRKPRAFCMFYLSLVATKIIVAFV